VFADASVEQIQSELVRLSRRKAPHLHLLMMILLDRDEADRLERNIAIQSYGNLQRFGIVLDGISTLWIRANRAFLTSRPTMSSLCALRLPEGQPSLYASRSIDIIDCLQLPHTVQWHRIASTGQAFEAIKSMKIRGAPAIASLAAVSIACELMNILDQDKSNVLESDDALQTWLTDRSEYLLSSRPTAVNLREAMHRLQAIAAEREQQQRDVRQKATKIIEAAELVWTEDVARNVTIGNNGASWLLNRLEKEGAISAGESINVLTVCNTGSLATSVSNTQIYS
jgi:methylthioribose-1-phosphate isomerase